MRNLLSTLTLAAALLASPAAAEMTLEDVLTMRLGLRWDEWALPYTDPDNDLVALNSSGSSLGHLAIIFCPSLVSTTRFESCLCCTSRLAGSQRA